MARAVMDHPWIVTGFDKLLDRINCDSWRDENSASKNIDTQTKPLQAQNKLKKQKKMTRREVVLAYADYIRDSHSHSECTVSKRQKLAAVAKRDYACRLETGAYHAQTLEMADNMKEPYWYRHSRKDLVKPLLALFHGYDAEDVDYQNTVHGSEIANKNADPAEAQASRHAEREWRKALSKVSSDSTTSVSAFIRKAVKEAEISDHLWERRSWGQRR